MTVPAVEAAAVLMSHGVCTLPRSPLLQGKPVKVSVTVHEIFEWTLPAVRGGDRAGQPDGDRRGG